jgi:aminoglycoside/choline kinase family phosphotransferase
MSTVQVQAMVHTTRDASIRSFLEQHGAGAAERAPIPGDASFRRYERLRMPDGTSRILMDAPVEHEDVRPFVNVLHILRQAGYSAPVLYAQSPDEGLLLLEDLGDAIYGKLLPEMPEQEEVMYRAAVDVLVDVVKHVPVEAVPAYSEAVMMRELQLFTDWFLPRHPANLGADVGQALLQAFQPLLERARHIPNVLVLRDYHADNLLWLPERDGLKKVGLLDFQDALIGPASYDLVSLLEDARRDVPEPLALAMQEYYLSQLPEVDEQAFRESYAMMGAQRNLKILGIFARLAFRDGKKHYLTMLPRVWRYVRRDLQAPVLQPIADWFAQYLPEAIQDQPLHDR